MYAACTFNENEVADSATLSSPLIDASDLQIVFDVQLCFIVLANLFRLFVIFGIQHILYPTSWELYSVYPSSKIEPSVFAISSLFDS